MPNRNVYFVQPGYTFGDGEKKGVYLPYAAGTVAAYAWNNKLISNEFKLKGFTYCFDDIDESIAEFNNPSLVGFSNYVWNFEYNKQFARKLKSLYPECIIVFGGHQVPPGTSLLNECEYIDFLIHGEGEETFATLLLQLVNDQEYSSIPNLSYRNANNVPIKNSEALSDCTNYPSPYLEGTFDSIIENKNVEFYAIIETNRGCPFGCTYCDWGITKTSIKAFPEERIFEEIRWISKHKIEYCFAADANFGILDRDEIFADCLIDSKQKTGYPSRFDVTYAKGREDLVFRISKKLHDAGMFKGPSLSFQSLCTQALENIGRSNMTLDKFSGLLALYKGAGITPYSEMILGLPGETYESFCKGIGTLLEYGQHNYIDIFRCELLVNAPMSNPEYIKKHGIKFVRTPSIQHHIAPRSEQAYGYSNIVVATNTMNTEMWLRANMFALFLQSCHHMGLLKYFAIYLHYAKHIEYEAFYKAFVQWLEKDTTTFCGRIFKSIKEVFKNFLNKGTELSYVNTIFGNITWFPEEGAFLEFVLDSDRFYNEVAGFLHKYIIEDEIFEDLLHFQKSIVKRPGINKTVIDLTFDWYGYFSDKRYMLCENPEEKDNVLHIVDSCNPKSWEDYARENVWFGRRAGKTVFLSSCSNIEVAFLN